MKRLFFFFLAVLVPSFASATYSIAFIHAGPKLPLYTLDALKQARLFNEEAPIYLIANGPAINENKEALKNLKIKTIYIEKLRPSIEHAYFRGNAQFGCFWKETSERFYILDDFMQKYEINEVFHLENDNLLYADLSQLWPILKKNYQGMAITLDADNRGIAGFIYIANRAALKEYVQFANALLKQKRNDMETLALFKASHRETSIDTLPIIMPEYLEDNPLLNSLGYSTFNPPMYINHFNEIQALFDAAALGQFIGGTHSEKTPGYINPACLFNPALLHYEWIEDDRGRVVPYAIYKGKKYPIINLHIHSKLLDKYTSFNNLNLLNLR